MEKTYIKDDLTIKWNASKCIHAAECVKGARKVFKPKDKPWVQPENDSKEVIKSAIDKCPSGALSYVDASANKKKNVGFEAAVMKNGPLRVKGHMDLTLHDGSKMQKDGFTAFCRCGQSSNQPFCDGTHKSVEPFE